MTATVAAVSMCKDEHDIAEATLRRMARQVDLIIVADNQSSDGTREILDRLEHELPLVVLDDPDPAYYQSEKMTRLAERAAAAGAAWIIPFDFDEIWLPRAGRRIANVLNSLPEGVLAAEALLFDHVATGRDPDIADPTQRLAWRRAQPAPLRKVAIRAVPGARIHQGNHGASFPGVRHAPVVTTALEVRHFPYRSVAQMVTKARNGAAAYAATALPEHVGAHWRGYGRILSEHGEAGIADIFNTWYWRADPASSITIHGEQQPPLVHDPAQ